MESGRLPPPILVPLERVRDFQAGSRLEWLEPDGRGGYASGTVAGANTRRYHGILVVARRPPTDRILLLSRLEETLVTADGAFYELAANHYPGAIHPHGYRYLEGFRLDPWPIWRYRLGGLVLIRELFVARGPGATILRYRIEGGDARLEIRPLVAGRDFHALVMENDVVARSAAAEPGLVVYQPYPGIPPLFLSHGGGEWHHDRRWYRQTIYPREAERGLDDREDLYNPGVLSAHLSAGDEWILACATAPIAVGEVAGWAEEEVARRERAAESGRRLGGEDPILIDLGARLGLAADTFVVRREGEESILAGYPWFADWGRDAMISIPGICLVTGRGDTAAGVLRAFATHLRDGLIPNHFPDSGGEVPDDHYNAADASLWFVEAVAALGEAGGDVREFWPAVQEILRAYREGTRFGIGMDGDGLIRHGAAGVQLTWMDARVDGWVVTPRAGKAVEINALWYNALERAAILAPGAGADAAPYKELARRVRDAFSIFHYKQGGYLYDRIDPAGVPDPALRPNQIFAVSLPNSPIGDREAAGVIRAVEQELLVPLGIRTLAPDATGYKGRCEGGRHERDSAYHSGTAWPWLLGPFITGYLRVHGKGEDSRRRMREILEPVRTHLLEEGLGQISEVVAGDPPHRPGGCFAQAWSCAELLRVLPEIAEVMSG
jgi:predicted glycogen debranching enzyme